MSPSFKSMVTMFFQGLFYIATNSNKLDILYLLPDLHIQFISYICISDILPVYLTHFETYYFSLFLAYTAHNPKPVLFNKKQQQTNKQKRNLHILSFNGQTCSMGECVGLSAPRKKKNCVHCTWWVLESNRVNNQCTENGKNQTSWGTCS